MWIAKKTFWSFSRSKSEKNESRRIKGSHSEKHVLTKYNLSRAEEPKHTKTKKEQPPESIDLDSSDEDYWNRKKKYKTKQLSQKV